MADYGAEANNRSYDKINPKGNEEALELAGEKVFIECPPSVPDAVFYEFKEGFFIVLEGAWGLYDRENILNLGCVIP
jgi:hypothetical protein